MHNYTYYTSLLIDNREYDNFSYHIILNLVFSFPNAWVQFGIAAQKLRNLLWKTAQIGQKVRVYYVKRHNLAQKCEFTL